MSLSSHREEWFQPTWQSLGRYSAPDWFRDAKFGIFVHWGAMSVPERSCWYARQMYLDQGSDAGDEIYRYHLEHYGHPSEFGFKDLIPSWTANRWDPGELARLFRDCGARYVVPVAVHHDNVDNYASTYQSWNSVVMGPRRDVVGEWKSAVESVGLRFGVSSHNDRSWQWLHPSHGQDVSGAYAGVPYDGVLTKADGEGLWWEGHDPQDLYCRPHEGDPFASDDTYMQCGEPPDEAFANRWYMRTLELVEKYEPDLLYFDGPLPLGEHGLKIAAEFYNRSMARHAGQLEAVLNIKSWGPGTVPDESAVVLDVEKGVLADIRAHAWQTDTSILPDWVYTPGPHALSDTVIVHNMCDIVSKNGNLLLNVGPRADGSLPEDQRATLRAIGTWLGGNGEAIYGTRPWIVFGEGPSQVPTGDFRESTQPLTSRDIRFTAASSSDHGVAAGTVFAIVMGRAEDGVVAISSIADATHVGLLGSDQALRWRASDGGLVVELPAELEFEHALTLRVEGPVAASGIAGARSTP